MCKLKLIFRLIRMYNYSFINAYQLLKLNSWNYEKTVNYVSYRIVV